jgi:hypothetical protein
MKNTEKRINFNTRLIKATRSLDRILISVLILLSLLLVSSNGAEFYSGIIITFLCLISLVVFAIAEVAYNFFNSSKTLFKEITYSGSLDELVRELSGFGIEPKTQVGKTYVFTTTPLLLPRRSLFVKDMGASCELYGLYLDGICKLEN